MSGELTLAEFRIVGHVANKKPLMPTPGGFLATTILVHQPFKGNLVPNYISVRWFAPASEDIAARFKPGDYVEVTGRIKTEKRQGAQFWTEYLAGETMEEFGGQETEGEFPF